MKRIYTTTDLVRIGVCAVLAPVAAFLAIGTPGLRWPALFVAGCLATFLAVPLLERRQQRREQVTFDDKTIRRVMRRGGVETIAWREVDEIQIITTDEGPGQDDVFWLLLNHDGSRGCAVSNAAEGFPALLAALQQLPGFDNAAVVRAMGSATNQRFTMRTLSLAGATGEYAMVMPDRQQRQQPGRQRAPNRQMRSRHAVPAFHRTHGRR